ncbi:MAG: helix-hairpin-helix domain-containing protein [bacterium]|nr:MAG: helix-hairpin-helix domain-containing protein [bacterium]
MENKKVIIKELMQIPGVGPSIAEDLWTLGIRSIVDLKGEDPERLYHQLCVESGLKLDRCVLYVFRCAVYYASHQSHDPDLLRWWNWKEREI